MISPTPNGVATPEFSEYVGELFRGLKPETVVEVGPDNRLSLMPRLGRLCGRYVGVALPEDCERSQQWYAMHQEMGVGNIELIAGNAIDLPKIVPKADVILVHNVLLDLTGNDTALMWEYRRGQREPNEEEAKKLQQRFAYAKAQGYRGFLEVANPGLVLTFNRATGTEPFIEGITTVVGVDRAQISVEPLLYDGGLATDEQWELITIDNRPGM